jgi:serine O-acetyltransferase
MSVNDADGSAPSLIASGAVSDRRLVGDDQRVKPELLWWWSTRLHHRGLTPLAKVLKSLNFLLFKAVLPYECHIRRDVTLWHRGVGTVIHPNTVVGAGVRIAHNVTVAAGTWHIGDGVQVVIGDGVTLGVGSIIVGRDGQTLHIGGGATIGANATVTGDVPEGALVLGARSQIVDRPRDAGARPNESR